MLCVLCAAMAVLHKPPMYASVLANPERAGLVRRQAELLARLHSVRQEYLDSAPEVQSLRQELRRSERRLREQSKESTFRHPFFTPEDRARVHPRHPFFTKEDAQSVRYMLIQRP